MPIPIVFDTDPSDSDAMGLFMSIKAARAGLWDLKAITLVRGHTSVDRAVINTLRILEAADFKIDVHEGCDHPMVLLSELEQGVTKHRYDAFQEINFPEPKDWSCLRRDVHAVDRLLQLSKEYEGRLTIIVTGPLTNIAMAIRMDKKFAGRIKEMYIFGGNVQGLGNISPCAEYNFWCDPEAAHVVLSNIQFPCYVAPLELCMLKCRQPLSWRRDVIGSIDSREVQFMNTLELYCMNQDPSLLQQIEKHGYILFEQLLVAVALKPSIVKKFKHRYATVELYGKDTRGQMAIDHINLKKKRPNVMLIDEVYISEVLELIQWGMNCPNTRPRLI